MAWISFGAWYYRGADKSLARQGRKQANVSVRMAWISFGARYYRGADKSLARQGRKQANVSVRMVWISFCALPCRKKETWWQLASRCCWNRARPWHTSEHVSFLVGLRTHQHPSRRRRNRGSMPRESWPFQNAQFISEANIASCSFDTGECVTGGIAAGA